MRSVQFARDAQPHSGLTMGIAAQKVTFYGESLWRKSKIVLIRRNENDLFISKMSEKKNTFKSTWNFTQSDRFYRETGANDTEIVNNFGFNEINYHFASIHKSYGADLGSFD